MPTSSSAMRFCTSNAIRESRYRTSFSRTKFFFDCEDIRLFRSRRAFWACMGVSRCSTLSPTELMHAHLGPNRPQFPSRAGWRSSISTARSRNIASRHALSACLLASSSCSAATPARRRNRTKSKLVRACAASKRPSPRRLCRKVDILGEGREGEEVRRARGRAQSSGDRWRGRPTAKSALDGVGFVSDGCSSLLCTAQARDCAGGGE